MRVNYKGNKMRKEAARKQEQEAKRLKRLNEIAIRQILVLTSASAIKKLKG